ncbi:uncharacterized protein LOC144119562 [Amblyomma americanum]
MLFMTRTHIRYLCSACAVLNGWSVWQYLRGFYRKLYAGGWVFDILFGTECAFTLFWDVVLFKTLRRRVNPTWADHDPDKIVRTLLWFLRATTVAACVCYAGALCEMFVYMKHVDFVQLRKDYGDNATSIRSLKVSFVTGNGALYTATMLAKFSILYGIYCYYRRYKDHGDSLEESEAAIADAIAEQPVASVSGQSSHSGSGTDSAASATHVTSRTTDGGHTGSSSTQSKHGTKAQAFSSAKDNVR